MCVCSVCAIQSAILIARVEIFAMDAAECSLLVFEFEVSSTLAKVALFFAQAEDCFTLYLVIFFGFVLLLLYIVLLCNSEVQFQRHKFGVCPLKYEIMFDMTQS